MPKNQSKTTKQNENHGTSSFILLYHRTPFEEGKDKSGERVWLDQKSPNGIIPTLRNLFRSHPNGTWIAWRKAGNTNDNLDETINMSKPSKFDLVRIPLTEDQITSFYHVTSKESFWPILPTFPTSKYVGKV